MTKIVYTMGYDGRKLQDIAEIARRLDATVFDIRYLARSRNPWFNRGRMQEWLGDRYQRVRDLGNINYKGTFEEIEIVDLEAGIHRIELSQRAVILLCVCKDYATCHRSVIAAELLRRGFSVKEFEAVQAKHAQPAVA
jgi:uncharacterized protein (DUF488 family)